MIALRVAITGYDKYSNTCAGLLPDGSVINIDPFVSCAIPMTDEECKAGKGFEVVGNTYILTEYSVYSDMLVPHEGGMIPI